MSRKINKVGRPSKLDGVDMDLLEKLYKAGVDDTQVAKIIGVNRTTLWNWRQSNKEFLNTLKDWKDEADLEVEKSLYTSACGFSKMVKRGAYDKKTHKLNEWEEEHYFPPNPTSMIFWLKNRKPKQWRERNQNPNEGDKKNQIIIAVQREEYQDRLRVLERSI